ncbi:MAG: hypothetical protein DMF65_10670 [Acidobacteria bacterium]|nr:MAG: hypothetical protein DMF65_10670 [Acidobacteriota bacterium]
MTENLTEEVFAQNLNTKFRVRAEAPRPVELELVEVKGWTTRPEEQKGLERFSLMFIGPADIYMPQQTYTLEHEQMGALDIFLVPTGRDERGFQYHAIFNFFKESNEE